MTPDDVARRRAQRKIARAHLAAYGDAGLSASPRLMRAACHLYALDHRKLAEVVERLYLDDLKLRAKYIPWTEADGHELKVKIDRLRAARGLPLKERE